MEAGFIVLIIMGCLASASVICILVGGIIKSEEEERDWITVCRDEHDCSYWETCHKGKCEMACKNRKCPRDEVCTSYFHKFSCECIHGYIRLPNSTCINNVITP